MHTYPGWKVETSAISASVCCIQVLDEKGLIDWDVIALDGSNIRALKAATGAKKNWTDPMPVDDPAVLVDCVLQLSKTTHDDINSV